MIHNLSDSLKEIFDWLAGALAIGTVLKFLPAVAALGTILWTGIRIHDRIKYGPSMKEE
jgi:hypothetical protein